MNTRQRANARRRLYRKKYALMYARDTARVVGAELIGVDEAITKLSRQIARLGGHRLLVI